MQNSNEMIHSIKTFFFDCQNIAVGILGTIVGYFLPVRDIVHVMIIFFIIDVIFGYAVSRKHNKSRFKVAVVWNHTVPRMLISIILVMACYMWDSVYHQEMVSTYNVVGWFISGVLIFSIAENAFLLTKWEAFLKVRDIFRKKIQDETGQDVAFSKKSKKLNTAENE